MTPFTDSQKAALDGGGNGRPRIQWDPKVSLGSVVSLVIMLAAGYSFVSGIQRSNDRQDLLIAQQEADAAANRAEVKAAIGDLQTQVRSLELTVRELQIELKARGR